MRRGPRGKYTSITARPPGDGQALTFPTIAALAAAIGEHKSVVYVALKKGGGKASLRGWSIECVSRFDPARAVINPTEVRNAKEARECIRSMLAQAILVSGRIASGEIDAPRGWDAKKTLDVCEMFGRSWGVDWKHVSDTRSESEKALDAAEKFLQSPPDLLAMADEEIEAVENAMLQARRHTMSIILRKYDAAEHTAEEPPAAGAGTIGADGEPEQGGAQEVDPGRDPGEQAVDGPGGDAAGDGQPDDQEGEVETVLDQPMDHQDQPDQMAEGVGEE